MVLLEVPWSTMETLCNLYLKNSDAKVSKCSLKFSSEMSESTDHYITRLRELVKTCNFGDIEHEMIHDQIVKKTCMPQIRESVFSLVTVYLLQDKLKRL